MMTAHSTETITGCHSVITFRKYKTCARCRKIRSGNLRDVLSLDNNNNNNNKNGGEANVDLLFVRKHHDALLGKYVNVASLTDYAHKDVINPSFICSSNDQDLNWRHVQSSCTAALIIDCLRNRAALPCFTSPTFATTFTNILTKGTLDRCASSIKCGASHIDQGEMYGIGMRVPQGGALGQEIYVGSYSAELNDRPEADNFKCQYYGEFVPVSRTPCAASRSTTLTITWSSRPSAFAALARPSVPQN